MTGSDSLAMSLGQRDSSPIRSAHLTRRQHGWSFVELLVVTSVVAVFLILLVPAVLKGRSAARRTRCLNNLKQIGLALSSYEQLMQVLPPGCVDVTEPILNQTEGLQISWTLQILPYLSHGNLYQQFDFSQSIHASENAVLSGTRISSFLCASFPDAGAIDGVCYAGNIGGSSLTIDSHGTGVLYLNSSIGNQQISDGKSCTLLCGELSAALPSTPAKSGWMAGTAATLRSAGVALNSSSPQDYVDVTELAGGFGSWHSDSFGVLFADGSVQAMSLQIEPQLLRRLGDRNDGEMQQLPQASQSRRVYNRQRLDRVRSSESTP